MLKKSASEMSNLPNVAFRGDQGLCMAEWPSYASPKTIDPTKNCKVKKLHLSNYLKQIRELRIKKKSVKSNSLN